MLKIFLICAGIILIGLLMLDDTYNFSVTAFGYEYTFSAVLLIIGLLILAYVFSLIKKPFCWIKNYKNRRFQKNLLKKENFLTFVLTTVLDKNNTSEKNILTQEKSLFAKGSTEALLFEALFNPSENIFEKLKNNKTTELAGMRGLFLMAQNKGDIDSQSQILDAATTLYPTVLWILQERLKLQLLQNDWQGALQTLEKLNKQKTLSKEDYAKTKACILYGLKQYKEAFDLMPQNPPFAWAYADTVPNKAEDILKKSWALTPVWETYERYYSLFKNETPASQMKHIEKLIAPNSSAKLSLLALADTAMKNHLWGVAKENLQTAMNAYETTRQMALMMAVLEQEGWHHTEAAKEWENKASLTDTSLPWVCTHCHHKTPTWDNVCAVCNKCGTLTPQG